VDAVQARELGAIDRLAADPHAETSRLAERIASNAPLAVSAMLAAIRVLGGPASAADLDRLTIARQQTIDSADLLEAVAAFAEKRPPRFRGR
jgi:enoyl-CoA hydratase